MRNICLLTLFLTVLAGPVSAHTALSTSTPMDGAAVRMAPETLQLEFTESVRLLRLELYKTGQPGDLQVAVDFSANSNSLAEYSIPLPALAAGRYRIDWTVMGADSHTVKGEVAFSINPNAVHSSRTETHENHAASPDAHGNH